MSVFPSAVFGLNVLNAFTSTTVADPPCLLAAAAVDGVVPPLLPAQALRAMAAAAATPTALEIRPKRIPPPCFCGVGDSGADSAGQTPHSPSGSVGRLTWHERKPQMPVRATKVDSL